MQPAATESTADCLEDPDACFLLRKQRCSKVVVEPRLHRPYLSAPAPQVHQDEVLIRQYDPCTIPVDLECS